MGDYRPPEFYFVTDSDAMPDGCSGLVSFGVKLDGFDLLDLVDDSISCERMRLKRLIS